MREANEPAGTLLLGVAENHHGLCVKRKHVRNIVERLHEVLVLRLLRVQRAVRQVAVQEARVATGGERGVQHRLHASVHHVHEVVVRPDVLSDIEDEVVAALRGLRMCRGLVASLGGEDRAGDLE